VIGKKSKASSQFFVFPSDTLAKHTACLADIHDRKGIRR
jgi:hypothetical protein